MSDLTGNTSRIDFLREQVKDGKKNLKHWEELLTHEICLINGQYYPVKNQHNKVKIND